MRFIDCQGLLLGQRIGECSDEAQLHFARIASATNSYGRILVNYKWIIRKAYAGFKNPPTREQITGWLHEYHDNFLMFVWDAADGAKWGQFDAPAKCLGGYRLARDTDESPDPPAGQLKAYKASYVEWLRIKRATASNDDDDDSFLAITPTEKRFGKLSENLQNVCQTSEKFGSEVVVVVAVEKDFAQATPSPVQSLPSAEKKPDPRHQVFKAALFGWWERTFGVGAEPPWGGDCGRHMDELLRSLPGLTVERFETCLKHRGQSTVNTSEHPRKWLRNVTDYEREPLDAYGKPKSMSKPAPQTIVRRAPGPHETSQALKRQDDAREGVLSEWRAVRARGHPDYEREAPRWVRDVLDGEQIGEVA